MKIHVTSEEVGKSTLKEYNKQLGIYAAPLYIVPTYRMKVEGVGDFEVIRVGLSRVPSSVAPKSVRRCDVGVFHAQTITSPTWVDYSPQTGPGTVPGAVRLWKEKGFLIHEGPALRDRAMGTYGCVEVMGAAEWNQFVQKVKSPTQRGKVTLVFDALTAPDAQLAIKSIALRKKWAAALHEKAMSPGKYKGLELSQADIDGLMTVAEGDRQVTVDETRDLYFIGMNYVMPKSAARKLEKFVERHGKAHGLF
jgi:hypothetical protein